MTSSMKPSQARGHVVDARASGYSERIGRRSSHKDEPRARRLVEELRHVRGE